MIAFLDVYYHGKESARGACILADSFKSSIILEAIIVEIERGVHPYVSGEFYKRELPILMKLLENVDLSKVELVVVDGYVSLSPTHPGLGYHLWEALEKKIPVIGVAKSHHIEDTTSGLAIRGNSRSPLYVTSIGFPQDEATRMIKEMDGSYRIPDLLKKVDKLTKEKSRCEIEI